MTTQMKKFKILIMHGQILELLPKECCCVQDKKNSILELNFLPLNTSSPRNIVWSFWSEKFHSNSIILENP